MTPADPGWATPRTKTIAAITWAAWNQPRDSRLRMCDPLFGDARGRRSSLPGRRERRQYEEALTPTLHSIGRHTRARDEREDRDSYMCMCKPLPGRATVSDCGFVATTRERAGRIFPAL